LRKATKKGVGVLRKATKKGLITLEKQLFIYGFNNVQSTKIILVALYD
jgi:hypothetical protein